jgi:transcriptional regulator with XRE-family HTH domain
MTTAERIKALRLARGLTQTQLAERCKDAVQQPHIARVETGRWEPRLATLRSIAAGLEVDPAVLVRERCPACGEPLCFGPLKPETRELLWCGVCDWALSA